MGVYFSNRKRAYQYQRRLKTKGINARVTKAESDIEGGGYKLTWHGGPKTIGELELWAYGRK